MLERPKTIICDIDGVIFKHHGDITQQHLIKPVVLPGVLDALRAWDIKGYHIILITGRRESVRKHTEKQLAEAGIFHDCLIMGVTGGIRVLINDTKVEGNVPTAKAYCVIRNSGSKDLKDI